jgi:hypothetical protein
MNLEPAVRRLRVNGRPRAMSAREYDEEIALMRRQLSTQPDTGKYGWERAREARDVAGSYRELDAAVHVLRSRRPGLRIGSETSLGFLSELMGPKIKVPAVLQAELAEARREVALELHGYGWTAGEIGRALGISREKVGRMLKPAHAHRR